MNIDNKTCIDRNECAEWGYCDQLCTNTEGDYICSCAKGYFLQSKNRCIASNASLMMIYFAHENAVVSMNYQGNDVRIVANTTGATGLDYHYRKGLLFWSDIKTRRV